MVGGGGRAEAGRIIREIRFPAAQVRLAVAEKVWLVVESTPRVSALCWHPLKGSQKRSSIMKEKR